MTRRASRGSLAETERLLAIEIVFLFSFCCHYFHSPFVQLCATRDAPSHGCSAARKGEVSGAEDTGRRAEK